MIYSVHGYYSKIGSRKHQAKIEAIVFASNEEKAVELVKGMFDGYPATFDYFSAMCGQETDINKIYAQRPELIGHSPDTEYIYNEIYHKNVIQRYYK